MICSFMLLQNHVLRGNQAVLLDGHDVAAVGHDSGMPFQGVEARLEVLAGDVRNDGALEVHDGNVHAAGGLELDGNGRVVEALDFRRACSTTTMFASFFRDLPFQWI